MQLKIHHRIKWLFLWASPFPLVPLLPVSFMDAMPECVVQHSTRVILMQMTEDRVIHSFLFSTIRGMPKGQKELLYSVLSLQPTISLKTALHRGRASRNSSGRRCLSPLCTRWALVRNPCRKLNHHTLKGAECSLRFWNYIFSIYGGLDWEGKIGVGGLLTTQGCNSYIQHEKLWMMKESYQHLLRVAAWISEHDNYWMPRKHHFCPIQWI